MKHLSDIALALIIIAALGVANVLAIYLMREAILNPHGLILAIAFLVMFIVVCADFIVGTELIEGFLK